jgi:hypothetical protein
VFHRGAQVRSLARSLADQTDSHRAPVPGDTKGKPRYPDQRPSPTASLDDNLEKLRLAAAAASVVPIEAFTKQLMSRFGPREDDVAMIAIRRMG